MHKIISVLPLSGCRIQVKFTDNVEGIIDLSDMKGKGIFSAWDDEKVFNMASVNAENNTVTWPGGIDLCPDVLYAEVTGKDIDSILKAKAGV